ncbi:hypothetical protein BHE74_00041209 [Ensete ventricosum]|nr:hypothetical protein GW17_00053452 [Ensete ventricosum]RWW52400.1 hypothetical protein BHE74_00041209 [Ensete ventricosum]
MRHHPRHSNNQVKREPKSRLQSINGDTEAPETGMKRARPGGGERERRGHSNLIKQGLPKKEMGERLRRGGPRLKKGG